MSSGLLKSTTYYVMHRPKHPLTGEIIKGRSTGGKFATNGKLIPGGTLWYPKATDSENDNGTFMSNLLPLVPKIESEINEAGKNITFPLADWEIDADLKYIDSTIPVNLTPEQCQVNGEPWILHSTHYSAQSALEAAKALVMHYQKENVKIVKGVEHELFITFP